jgi:hypothetical protein
MLSLPPLFTQRRGETVRKGGTSHAPIAALAGIRRAQWTEKPLFGGPQGYAASASEAFRQSQKVGSPKLAKRKYQKYAFWGMHRPALGR